MVLVLFVFVLVLIVVVLVVVIFVFNWVIYFVIVVLEGGEIGSRLFKLYGLLEIGMEIKLLLIRIGLFLL